MAGKKWYRRKYVAVGTKKVTSALLGIPKVNKYESSVKIDNLLKLSQTLA